jgi:hypothetical protein
MTTETGGRRGLVPAAIILALGLAVGGFFIGQGLFRARATERSVTVKGLSEREIAANLVIWPIPFTVTANDLATLQERVDAATGIIRNFLKDDFDTTEIGVSVPRVTDREAEGYSNRPNQERYVAQVIVSVRTMKIAGARALMNRSGELVKRGVPLTHSYEHTTQYFYTDLEKIKPEMIAEATKDARRAAERFAEDSGASVGAIKNAQQGYFSVEDRDPFSPEHKRVRVVTSIQYLLVN